MYCFDLNHKSSYFSKERNTPEFYSALRIADKSGSPSYSHFFHRNLESKTEFLMILTLYKAQAHETTWQTVRSLSKTDSEQAASVSVTGWLPQNLKTQEDGFMPTREAPSGPPRVRIKDTRRWCLRRSPPCRRRFTHCLKNNDWMLLELQFNFKRIKSGNVKCVILSFLCVSLSLLQFLSI